MEDLGVSPQAVTNKIQLKNVEIKKIIKVDYPRGRAKEYYANCISAKKPKIEFSLFHPTVPNPGHLP